MEIFGVSENIVRKIFWSIVQKAKFHLFLKSEIVFVLLSIGLPKKEFYVKKSALE